VPKKDLLIKEGFVPPPKGHELELVDLTDMESAQQDKEGEGGEDGQKRESKGEGGGGGGPALSKKPTSPKGNARNNKIHPV
jgi:hypothetical protein